MALNLYLFFFLSLLFQIESLQQENNSLKKQCQKVKEQFQQQKVSHLIFCFLYWLCDK